MTSTTAPAAAWTFTVAGWPPSPNVRLHNIERWRRCKPFSESIAWQCRAVGLPEPLLQATVVITLVRDRGQALDPDNAVSAVKPLVDGLVVGRLLAGDTEEHITLTVRQERGPRRGARIEIWSGSGLVPVGPASDSPN
jgi:hypothetical protein